MNRRQLIKTSVNALLFSTIYPVLGRDKSRTGSRDMEKRLFFLPEDLPRIRDNSKTPLLKDYFRQCLEADLKEDRDFLKGAANTRDLIVDLRKLHVIIHRESLVYLVANDKDRKQILLDAVSTVLQMPKWDYFQTGDNRTFGLQRGPGTIIALLFAREVLGKDLSDETQQDILTQLAAKGCQPCFRALWGMENQERVSGWHFDPEYFANYDINMNRWPVILDRTNLKAIPVAGLGIGALALDGFDPRAEEWLNLAVMSAKEYLELYAKDGSYFEGLSYADYSLRNLFMFFEAHQRLRGDIDWFDQANFYGVSEYLVCMQLGRQLESDVPDIVNFSDARNSFQTALALWIANHGNDGLAQFAAENYTGHNEFLDFLWYKSGKETRPPSESLKNKHFDLDWVVCRTGWAADDSFVAFRGGQPSNHEHADRNSFIFKAYGERLLTDHFGAPYDWRDKAWVMRLTEGHNAVLVDGRGHQYHDGSEGTNSSQASAHITRFVDRGDVVWWCSDATHAYQLVNKDIDLVMRSILFAKPDVLILFDQLRKKGLASTFSARFHPDNRDGKARFEFPDGKSFVIRRPKASLYAKTEASLPAKLTEGKLEVPEPRGQFPFAELTSEASRNIQMVTVLVAQKGNGKQPEVVIRRDGMNWQLKVNGAEGTILTEGDSPEMAWYG